MVMMMIMMMVMMICKQRFYCYWYSMVMERILPAFLIQQSLLKTLSPSFISRTGGIVLAASVSSSVNWGYETYLTGFCEEIDK